MLVPVRERWLKTGIDYWLGGGSERLFKGLEFIRKKPTGTIIFTGFSRHLLHEGLLEAEIIEKSVKALNIDSANILFERPSRNTF